MTDDKVTSKAQVRAEAPFRGHHEQGEGAGAAGLPGNSAEHEKYCSDCAWPYECAAAKSCHRRDLGEVRSEDCSALSSGARCARPDTPAPARSLVEDHPAHGLVLEFPTRLRPLRLSCRDLAFLGRARPSDAAINAFLGIDLATGADMTGFRPVLVKPEKPE